MVGVGTDLGSAVGRLHWCLQLVHLMRIFPGIAGGNIGQKNQSRTIWSRWWAWGQITAWTWAWGTGAGWPDLHEHLICNVGAQGSVKLGLAAQVRLRVGGPVKLKIGWLFKGTYTYLLWYIFKYNYNSTAPLWHSCLLLSWPSERPVWHHSREETLSTACCTGHSVRMSWFDSILTIVFTKMHWA